MDLSDHIFYEASATASVIGSSVSNDSLGTIMEQALPHAAACFVKLSICPSFVGIILTLAAILS
jgi:hypothetical protein